MEKPTDISLQRLLSLRYWLKYELSTTLLYILSIFSSILLLLMAVCALIFAPYMLWVLIKEKKYGWIITLIIMITLPWLFILFFPSEYIIFMAIIPLACFYLYCFLLKITIDDWIAEKRAYIERVYKVKPVEKFEDLWSKR